MTILHAKNELNFVKNDESYNIYGIYWRRVLKLAAAPQPFCVALTQSVDWRACFYVAVLSIIFFLDIMIVSGDLTLTVF